MAGHSHSSNIKFRKDRVDSKRGKLFAKLSRMITVAARQGGGSVDGNAKLRLVVDKARVVSMPKDGIERAIRKGTGAGELGDYEEIVYEGYGPGGIAVIMEILTDNRHRTAADVRMVMEKYGGNLGASGAVAWMFERRGRFVLDPTLPMGARSHDTPPPWTDERLLELALAIGADDFTRAHGDVVLGCRPTDFAAVASALVARAIPLREAVLAYAATQRVLVDDAALAGRFQDMVEALEDHDDVQTVFSNVEFGAAAQPPRHAPGA